MVLPGYGPGRLRCLGHSCVLTEATVNGQCSSMRSFLRDSAMDSEDIGERRRQARKEDSLKVLVSGNS